MNASIWLQRLVELFVKNAWDVYPGTLDGRKWFVFLDDGVYLVSVTKERPQHPVTIVPEFAVAGDD